MPPSYASVSRSGTAAGPHFSSPQKRSENGGAAAAWICAVAVAVFLSSRAEVCAAGSREGVLRLGYFPNVTHAQALYARATGEFEKQTGSAIQWISFSAGPAAVESLFADAIDATFVGPGPTINGYLRSKGSRFVIVSGSAGGGAGLVVRRDSGIETDRDFDHKTIATPQLGNTQDVSARNWFAEKGYRLRERGGTVTLAPLANSDQLTLFRKKQIDGAWTVEPWLARLEEEGGGRVMFEEKSLWPDGRYVTTHLVVNKPFLADHSELIKKLIAALVDITERINSDKSAAALVLNQELKKETGKALKDEVMQKAMSRVEFTWDPLTATLRQSAAAARRAGFIRNEPALEGIYSLALLNGVLKEKNLPPVAAPGF